MHTTFETILEVYRKRFGVKRQAIYEGICGKSTFFCAELQEVETDLLVQETLLSRLGVDLKSFEIILDDETFEMSEARQKIHYALRGNQYDVAQEKIREYRRAHVGKHFLHEQVCVYYEMKLAKGQKVEAAQIGMLAEKALSITKKIDGVPDVKRNLYTPMELDLLLTVIQCHYGCWDDIRKNRGCLEKIIEYVELYFERAGQVEIVGNAWLELVKLEEEIGNTEVALECVDKAIACFVKGTGILCLANVRFLKGKLLYKISTSAENKDELTKKSRTECLIAYNIYDVMKRIEERNEVKCFCEEMLQWPITEQIEW